MWIVSSGRGGGSLVLGDNDIKAELSYAYLHAVAARAGFACEYGGRHADGLGIDARIDVKERLRPPEEFPLTRFTVHIQLKATATTCPLIENRYSYSLTLEHYDKLREEQSPPIFLVLFLMPNDPAEWLSASEEQLITKRCAYWVSLAGAADSGNRTEQTIYVPKINVVDVDGLRALATRIAGREEITYEG